ncbi:hypothetical protein RB195_024626 [Necator americanus]|uniref:BZIP domain-containing protein n=1 Tax=Necator americanus TaxID=51031 RepID=A0ABR1EPJ5_NECAM
MLYEKNKRKSRVAKAYAEQNRRLKRRLKEMKEEFHEMKKNHLEAEAGTIQPSPGLNGLETWSNLQLIELITKLRTTRLRRPSKKTVNEVKAALEVSDGGYYMREYLSRTIPEMAFGSERLPLYASSNERQINDQVLHDVLLYVFGDLTTAHSERQIISKKLSSS